MRHHTRRSTAGPRHDPAWGRGGRSYRGIGTALVRVTRTQQPERFPKTSQPRQGPTASPERVMRHARLRHRTLRRISDGETVDELESLDGVWWTVSDGLTQLPALLQLELVGNQFDSNQEMFR